MKKLLVALLFVAVVATAAVSAQTKVGLLGGYPSSLTVSFGDLEIQVGSAFVGLNVSADYKIFKQDLSFGETTGFFWNAGIGAYAALGVGWFGVGAMVPIEFGWVIPEFMEERLDIYLQFSPGLAILPSIGFYWDGGVGIRYRF